MFLSYKLRLALWSSMRRLRNFTPADLEAGSGATEQQVKRWLLMCNKAGFAAPAPTPGAVRRGSARTKAWRIVKDIGPVPPAQQRELAALRIQSTSPAVQTPPAAQWPARSGPAPRSGLRPAPLPTAV